MSYSDPYYARPQAAHQYSSGQAVDPPFNPPYDPRAPHQPYGQGGVYDGEYRDDPVFPESKEQARSVFEDEYADKPIGPKTTRNMRKWRYDHQGNLWSAGGRGRCIGRFFCCTVMIFVFVLLSIILSLALWIVPPDILIGTPTLDSNSASAFTLTSDGLSVSLAVAVSVSNPNYFSVKLNNIEVDLTYPINSTSIGNGTKSNIDFSSHTQTNFTLPMNLTYSMADDPSYAVLTDIATKCGLIGSTTSDITVDYAIHLNLRVFFIPIKPTISSSFSFACPITSDEISSLLSAAGIDLGSLSSIAGLLLR